MGPEALISLLVGNVVTASTGANGTREEHATVATSLGLLVGLFTFALGLARLGFVDSVMSRALVGDICVPPK